MSKVFVGIDVSKEHSTAQDIDSDEKKLFYLQFSMDAVGLQSFELRLKDAL